MSEHIQRVMDEREQLAVKIDKLADFVYTDGGVFDALSKNERTLLSKQLGLMNAYLSILDERIHLFNLNGDK